MIPEKVFVVMSDYKNAGGYKDSHPELEGVFKNVEDAQIEADKVEERNPIYTTWVVTEEVK